MIDHQRYRRGVGVMLLNGQGKVWVGARIDNPADAWQMPQGGIDEGEDDPWATALRELEEETGIPPHLVERIAQCPERLRYELPPELVGVIWKEPWIRAHSVIKVSGETLYGAARTVFVTTGLDFEIWKLKSD